MANLFRQRTTNNAVEQRELFQQIVLDHLTKVTLYRKYINTFVDISIYKKYIRENVQDLGLGRVLRFYTKSMVDKRKNSYTLNSFPNGVKRHTKGKCLKTTYPTRHYYLVYIKKSK